MTRLLPLSLIALLAAGAASAETVFSLNRVQDTNTMVELGNVRSPATGTLEIYDFSRGEAGRLIGLTNLKPGVNQDVRVPIQVVPTHDALAVVKVDGETVAQQTLRFRD